MQSLQSATTRIYHYRDLEGDEREFILNIMENVRPFSEGCERHTCHRVFKIGGRIYQRIETHDGELLSIQECVPADTGDK